MRTTIIPAQITTVEDKLAGNLTVTQLLLLMFPVFVSAVLYILFFPVMALSLYKIILIATVTIICSVLAVRIKEKLILEWLQLMMRYNLRPARYIHSKDAVFARSIDPPIAQQAPTLHKVKQRKPNVAVSIAENMRDHIQLEYLLQTQSLSFKFAKKGELHVSME